MGSVNCDHYTDPVPVVFSLTCVKETGMTMMMLGLKQSQKWVVKVGHAVELAIAYGQER